MAYSINNVGTPGFLFGKKIIISLLYTTCMHTHTPDSSDN